MSAARDQRGKPQRENHTLCFWGHALLSHLYVNLLDYIPHKATAVPLLLALSVSRCICCACHQSILPGVSWCPGSPPASPRVLSDFGIQSGICPGGPPICRHLHSSDPVTGVEGNTLNFSRHSGMQDFTGVGTNEYGTHIESINRDCLLGQILWRFRSIWTAGDAISFVRPEVAECLWQHSDVAEGFHPISSIPPRHDEAQREAVHHRQWLVIHGVGDHYLPI